MAGKGSRSRAAGPDELEGLTPLEARLRRAQHRLNGNRLGLVRAIMGDCAETFYLSSHELARRYNVHAATIVRTAQVLGYERFADFASDLRQHFMLRFTPYTVMRAAAKQGRRIADHIFNSLDRDLENLSLLRSGLDPRRLIELARLIHRSRRILIVGVDLATSLASFLAYGLVPLGFNAEAPVGSEGNLQHKIRLLGKEDLLVAISFGRCLRVTVESVLRARERKVPTFGITDSDTTPIARYCDSYMIVPIFGATFTGSYVAPMAAINAILVACAHIKPGRSLALLRQIEKEYDSGSRWYKEPQRRSSNQRRR
jgi:RpiR family carbohydrate utilization transcriptional regulator